MNIMPYLNMYPSMNIYVIYEHVCHIWPYTPYLNKHVINEYVCQIYIYAVQSNLSLRPPVLSNYLPLKVTTSDPIKGKQVEIYLY